MDYKTEEQQLNSMLVGKRARVQYTEEDINLTREYEKNRGYNPYHYILSMNGKEGVVEKIVRTNYRSDGYYQYIVKFANNSILSLPLKSTQIKIIDDLTLPH